jgi:hypothetical protein
MLKEGAYAEENPTESIEQDGGFSEETIKRFFETRRSVQNEGNNALIFRVPYDELPPERQRKMDLEKGEDNPEGSLSIKALKVFGLGNAKKEFDALTEARDIVQRERGMTTKPMMRVPKASGFYEIHVGKEMEELLNKNGASILGGKVGLIEMDYIEGDDLAAVLHRELLNRLPSGDGPDSYRNDGVDNPTFEELFRALEKTDFVFPENLRMQIKNTVDAWHKKNFYHRDLHPRNIILKDGKLENGQLYGIDFATASHEKPMVTEDDDVKYLPDDGIVQRLSPLTKSAMMKKKEESMKIVEEWDERIALMEKQPKLAKQYDNIKNGLDSGATNILEGQFIISSSSDRDFQNFLAALLKLSRENPTHRGEIKKFIESHEKDKKTRSFVLNQMGKFKRVIEN